MILRKIPTDIWIVILAAVVSIIACVFFYGLGLNLSASDGLSRMDIARKITDNLTPGLGQFGSVWPFLPQLIMVPLVAFTPLWKSGIAGMIMSGTSFVFSGYFIYKIIFNLTKNKAIAVIGFLIFITNINLLLLQTMAMSECLFIALMLGAIYGLIVWIDSSLQSLFPLVFSAACLAGASLVRYEGIAFTFAAIACVFLIVLLKKNTLKKAEGITVFFATVALFGLFLWCLYNAMIFQDPFYWAKIYAGQNAVISTENRNNASGGKALDSINVSYLSKINSYTLAISEMAGLPIFIIGVIGLLFYFFSLRPSKDQKSLVVLLPLSIIAFMFLTFYKSGLPIVAPPLNMNSIHNFSLTYGKEYNVRYGILLWPLIVIMISWLVSKNNILKKIAILLLVIHVATPLYHKAFLMYQLPFGWSSTLTSDPENNAFQWFKANYDEGLILISALKYDPIMFKMDLPYKIYIHEGTGKYWLTSRTHPEVYAQWIFLADKKAPDSGEQQDPVTEYLRSNLLLNNSFEEKYSDGNIVIYKKRSLLASVFSTSDIRSSNNKSFSGKIIDNANMPVQDVDITTSSLKAKSDWDGGFFLTVPGQKVKITFKKPKYQTLSIVLDFSQCACTNDTIVMQPASKKSLLRTVLSYL